MNFHLFKWQANKEHPDKLQTPTGVEQHSFYLTGQAVVLGKLQRWWSQANSQHVLYVKNEMHQHIGEAVSQFCLCHEAIYCALLKLGRLLLGIFCMLVSPDLSIQVPCLVAAWYLSYEETLENTFLAAWSNKECCSQQLLFVWLQNTMFGDICVGGLMVCICRRCTWQAANTFVQPAISVAVKFLAKDDTGCLYW